MSSLVRGALVLGLVAVGSTVAVAAPMPIFGELNLTGVGGVNFGGGTASKAVFSSNGKGNVTDGNQTGAFSELSMCSGCVTFGSAAGAPAGDTQYTYGPLLTTTVSGNDTTYTHGPSSGLPLFSLLESNGDASSFTPVGQVTIDKLVNIIGGHASTSFILTALGTLTLTNYTPTEGQFSITTQGGNTFASFSATADAAPAPLAGAGLLSFAGAGLAGLRKRGRRLFGRVARSTAA